MSVAIIDYGMGNLKSVYNALKLLGLDPVITSNENEILKANGVILPGVGAFSDAINEIKRLKLDKTIKKITVPFLGICLGMQLLFEKSYEFGEHEGLGILKGEIVKFKDNGLKIPHIGWNVLKFGKKCLIFDKIKDESYVYYVHSYYLSTKDDIVTGYTKYGDDIPIAVQKNNFYGVQFHPEKSGDIGLSILKRFGELL